ncbi:MAG: DUF2868 domain-containing protein [Sulfurovum sp.]
MSINSYLNLHQLLEESSVTPEENRSFGLTNKELKDSPKEQLLAWTDIYKERLPKPNLGEKFSSYLYNITFIFVLFGFIFGLFSGIGLLSYNGKEPVNVIYFIFFVVFVPIVTMTFTLISMIRANRSKSVLVHLSPAFWMEKILALLPNKISEVIKDVKINPLLSNWMIIKRSQLIALFFSLGIFIGLLGVVVTKDIAFAWSTTLQITPVMLYDFVHFISYPWSYFVPSAMPSQELIEHSQYFRLGDSLSESMIANASSLGAWWQFLAFATLFYAISLRFVVLSISWWGFKYALNKSLFRLDGTMQLLREINEPLIDTNASNEEALFIPHNGKYDKIDKNYSESKYKVIQGLGMRYDELLVIADSFGVNAPKHFIVGGANSLDEDDKVIEESSGEVLLFVKAWEPPMMDFVDYLTDLTANKKIKKVVIMPIGTLEDEYKSTKKYIDIWANKLSLSQNNKVWLKR